MKEGKKVNNLKKSSNYSKWMKISAWAAVALVLFVVIFSIITQILTIVSSPQISFIVVNILQSLFVLVFSSLFIFGFYKIGKQYNSKILKIISLLFIVVYIISFIVQYSYFQQVSAEIGEIYVSKVTSLVAGLPANPTEEQTNQALGSLFQVLMQDENFVEGARIIFGLFIGYCLILGILGILMGVALIKLRDKIVLAKRTGILLIIGVLTSVIIIGLFVLLAAFIMQVMILFKEASKK